MVIRPRAADDQGQFVFAGALKAPVVAVSNLLDESGAEALPGRDAVGGKPTAAFSSIASPASAITAGADHIVVGRPVWQAADPAAAAQAILDELPA